jgi:N-dimethylarginine dimethylaminohydrolase
MSGTAQSETGTLTHLLVQHARDAFQNQQTIETQWKDLGFTSPPDLDRAAREYDAFLEILNRAGARMDMLPAGKGLTLDSLYVRDASIACDRGVILCRMGKPARAHEPAAQAETLRALNVPILGFIEAPGRLEGGDVLWLDERTIAVGRGYRTNAAGIGQLTALLGTSVDETISVALPHWKGPGDVFHLMSIISPIDRDLAVVFSPLMSVEFRERLLDRGMTLIEVPDAEFETMGANVLAIGPRRCVMVKGNPITRGRLEAAGVEVFEYEGREISIKGGGGPTCLTRPLSRQRSERSPRA